jgi:two-component system, OmpR family, sensor kinase
MSSSPPAERRWRPRSLRGRLILTAAALIAVVGLVISAVTALAVRAFLVDRVDDDLVTVARLAQRSGPLAPSSDDDDEGVEHQEGLEFLGGRGLPVGTFGAVIEEGEVEAAITGVGSVPRPVSEEYGDAIAGVPNDGSPHDLDLGDAGRFRALAITVPEGERTVIGLPLADVASTVNQVVLFEAAALGIAVLIAGIVGAGLVDRNLRPLRRVAATAREVSETTLDRGEVALRTRVPDTDLDPASEVGQVAAALNHMLSHVGSALQARHESETQVRQFVADASHELRTPLASIRGYAELTRRGRDEVPADVARSLTRIEAEASRMSELVDDMLLLARLDAGRPLAHAPVDLSRLAIDVVSDARAAGPEDEWRLSLPDQPVMVTGDDARLHQVLANLLSNARVHTPAGTTVTTTLSTCDEGVLVSVHDNGPGIAKEEQQRVFERFARVDTSRSRSSGSTGLGLAIVSAVVSAHGGSVRLDSRPGSTTFSVLLPH